MRQIKQQESSDKSKTGSNTPTATMASMFSATVPGSVLDNKFSVALVIGVSSGILVMSSLSFVTENDSVVVLLNIVDTFCSGVVVVAPDIIAMASVDVDKVSSVVVVVKVAVDVVIGISVVVVAFVDVDTVCSVDVVIATFNDVIGVSVVDMPFVDDDIVCSAVVGLESVDAETVCSGVSVNVVSSVVVVVKASVTVVIGISVVVMTSVDVNTVSVDVEAAVNVVIGASVVVLPSVDIDMVCSVAVSIVSDFQKGASM